MSRSIKLFTLLSVSFLFLSSCSVLSAAKKDGVSIDELNKCLTRTCIISKGATPLYSTKNESGEVIKETYQVQKPTGSAERAVMHGILDVFTLGLWELVGTPMENRMGMEKEIYYIKVYYENGEKIKKVELD